MALIMAPIIRVISDISVVTGSRGTIRLKAMSPITSPEHAADLLSSDRVVIAI
jgi:hypothetical protein